MKPTPKEKANELVEKFSNVHISTVPVLKSEAKVIALKCVDEILTELYDGREKATKHNNSRIKCWKEVKQEIEKL